MVLQQQLHWNNPQTDESDEPKDNSILLDSSNHSSSTSVSNLKPELHEDDEQQLSASSQVPGDLNCKYTQYKIIQIFKKGFHRILYITYYF